MVSKVFILFCLPGFEYVDFLLVAYFGSNDIYSFVHWDDGVGLAVKEFYQYVLRCTV